MIYPLLPAFVTGVLGAGPQALGALDGAAEFAAAFVKLGPGRLADRRSWRGPLIVIGYFTAVVVRPVIALAGAAAQVIGLRVVDRLGKGLRTPPRDALIADVTPAELRGRAFGLQRGLDHAGAVLGPLVAWWLLASGAATLRGVIGASIVPGVLVLVLAVWAVEGGRGTPSTVFSRPLPTSTAGSPRHLRLRAPPHARHADHPALPAARRARGRRAVVVGGGARRALVVELPRRDGERPARPRTDDVGGVADLRRARAGDGPRAHGRRSVGALPGLGARRGAHRKSGAGPRGAVRGREAGQRVWAVPWGDGHGGARGRRGARGGVSGPRRDAGVSHERRGGPRAGARVAGRGRETRFLVGPILPFSHQSHIPFRRTPPRSRRPLCASTGRATTRAAKRGSAPP